MVISSAECCTEVAVLAEAEIHYTLWAEDIWQDKAGPIFIYDVEHTATVLSNQVESIILGRHFGYGVC